MTILGHEIGTHITLKSKAFFFIENQHNIIHYISMVNTVY